MRLSADEPAKYLVARIQEALAQDSRSNVLDIQVKVVAQRIYLMGTVDSDERRNSVAEVVEELVPAGMTLLNTINVADYSRTPGEEVLA